MPPLNTHPELFSYNSERLALPAELVGMQGVDAFDVSGGARARSPMMRSLAAARLDEKEIKLLAGNGLHVSVFGAWFLYIFGNIRRRDVRLPSSLLLATTEVTDEKHASRKAEEELIEDSLTAPVTAFGGSR